MQEFVAKNLLKSWAREIMSYLNKNDNSDYINYKNFIIKIFTLIIFNKVLKNEKTNFSKDTIINDKIWLKLENLFLINEVPKTNLEEIDNIFYSTTIDFIVQFCNKYYKQIDNILAWLYQYLNINRIDNSHKDTQFFTDQYMVKYLVDEALKEYKLDFKAIDPACGGGNFLVELIEQLYLKSKFEKKDFLKIISENIFGYDIDKKLTLICLININIKLLELKVLTTDEILSYNFNIYTNFEENNAGALLKENKLLLNVSTSTKIKSNEIFSKKYNLLITNPPFKGKREQDETIRNYLIKNYKVSKGDICNSFVERLFDLVLDEGIALYVMQNTWMYLESFKDFRKKLLTEGSILSIVDLGSNSFYDLSGEKTTVCLLKYSPKKMEKHLKIYGLKDFSYEDKQKILFEIKDNYVKLETYDILEDSFFRIEYKAIGLIKKYLNNGSNYNQYAKVMQGTSTGDSKQFVKFHWEVSKDNKNWILVSKGGGYCKWSGLNIFKINWGLNGEEIRANPKSVIRNTQYFSKTDLVYSDTGTSGLNVRLLKKNQIFIASGPGILIKTGNKFCHLAFLNSRLASFYIKLLTPKLTISATYIGQIPVIPEILYDDNLENISKEIVKLKEIYNKKRPINIEYKYFDTFNTSNIYEFVKNDFLEDLDLELKRLQLEEKINNIILNYFKFSSEEKTYIYSEVGKNPSEIDENNNFDIKKIDEIISKSLDCNCYIKSSRKSKKTLGIEGILEFLSVNYGYNPQKSKDFIIHNLEKFEKTLLKYYKHFLHRIELKNNNFMTIENTEIETLTESELYKIIKEDLIKNNIKLDLENWRNKEIYDWHFKAFFKVPIIKPRR